MAAQLKALILPSKGADFVLSTRPVPTPGQGQLLVKNTTVALNPIDYYIRQSGYFIKNFPAIIGLDAAGEVAKIGEGVQGWTVGDRVVYQSDFLVQDRAAFQEYTIAQAETAAKIPANVSFDQAATIPLGLATAAVGTYYDRTPRGGAALSAPWDGGKDKYTGQAALVIGGASSVGQYALQLAKLSGFAPIITTASKRNEEYVKAAGASHFIDYNEVPYSDLPKVVSELAGGKPVTLVYDAVSNPDTQKASLAALSPKGSVVFVREPFDVKPGETEDGKYIAWVYGATPDGKFEAKLFAVLASLLESGDLKPNNVELLPGGLAGISEGVLRFATGVSATKLVVRLADTA